MSRIDDALKRTTGSTPELRTHQGIEGYAPEEGYTPEEEHAPIFVPPVPFTATPAPAAQRRTFAERKPVERKPMEPAHAHASETAAEAEQAAASEKLVDLRPVADYLGFLGSSIRRHKFLAAQTFLFAFALAATAAVVLPRTYHVQTKLLAQRNEVMTALSNPNRAVPWDADAPTRAAAETVLKRDNLITLIRQTDGLNEWDRTRIPILRLKDFLMRFVRPVPTADDKLDAMVGLLEARMNVTAGPVGDGTVTIELDWPNAEMAYRFVAAAQTAFIEARQTAERAAIRESIGILERYSATLHTNINDTLAELQRTQGTRRAVAPVRPAPVDSLAVTAALPPVPAAAAGTPALSAELDDPAIPRLKETLTSKRQELSNMENERQRQLADLQGRLMQATAVYTPQHPTVLAIQQQINAMSKDSPQLAALRAQVETTESDYQKRVAAVSELQQVEQLKAEFANRSSADALTAAAAASARRSAAVVPAPAPQADTPGTGENNDFASIRLRLELNQLESVLERTDGARIELAVSDAAFKYRYSIIQPPQVPRDPVRPNLRLIGIAGFIGAILLAVAAAAGKDLLSNRIFHRWQVERQLGLPVLGLVGTA